MRGPSPRRSLLAALLLCLCTLGSGFMLDDYLHLFLLAGGDESYVTGAWDLYRFTDGDPDHMLAMMNQGPHPWWSDPEVRIAFMRPLASLAANLDWRLFGAAPLGYHVHSSLWYLALVGAAWLLLRRALPGAVAGWALLLFVFEDAHAHTVAWVANRNALIAATPAFLGLLAHLRWREDGWRPGLPLSLLGLALGLGGAEAAVGVAGYWLAYELFAAPGRPAERARALAPVAALLGAYLALHGWMGYGAERSGTYLDPRSQPLDWLLAAPGHGLALVGALVFNAPVDVWYFSRALRPPLALTGLAGLGLILALLRWAWPGLAPETRRAVRWLGPGALFSMIPTLSVFPMARLLVVPSLGAAVVLAAVLVRFGELRGGAMSGLARVSCGLLVGLHVVLAPASWLLVGPGLGALSKTYEALALGAEVDDARITEQRVVLPAAPDPVVAYYTFVTRFVYGHPKPLSHRVLSLAPHPHLLTRVAEDAFELEVVGGELLTTPLETMFRTREAALGVGEVVRLEGMDVEVLDVGEEGPKRLRVRFDRPLEDPSLLFLGWEAGGLRRLTMPPVGETLRLQRPDTPFAQL
ncbi:MAG: hypothetical protein H6740_02480 [Alphaproteobacteria bacterium]|nr:hypothetical protein [Alphaproteobacteria bacterium]